ncbi:hypothetical protein KQI84_10040 [bacterium]|nr:hypothetical protein [bacterium]
MREEESIVGRTAPRLPWYLPATLTVWSRALAVFALVLLYDLFGNPIHHHRQYYRWRCSRTLSDARSIATSVESFHVDAGHYPPMLPGSPGNGLNQLTTPTAYLTYLLPDASGAPQATRISNGAILAGLLLLFWIVAAYFANPFHRRMTEEFLEKSTLSPLDRRLRFMLRRNLAIDSLLVALMFLGIAGYCLKFRPPPGYDFSEPVPMLYATDEASTWYILGGRGLDRDIDLPLFRGDQVPTLSTEEVARQLLANPQYIFDPTNGMESSGDILWLCEGIHEAKHQLERNEGREKGSRMGR